MIHLLLVACTLKVSSVGASITGLMAGDANPPGYSVVNIDLDTIERPPSVAKSVIGHVNAVDGMQSQFPYSSPIYR